MNVYPRVAVGLRPSGDTTHRVRRGPAPGDGEAEPEHGEVAGHATESAAGGRRAYWESESPMSRARVSRSALVASTVAIAVAGGLSACGGGAKHASTRSSSMGTHTAAAPTAGRTGPGRRVTVTVGARRTGQSLPQAFVGLAMED